MADKADKTLRTVIMRGEDIIHRAATADREDTIRRTVITERLTVTETAEIITTIITMIITIIIITATTEITAETGATEAKKSQRTGIRLSCSP